ncbi:hypothetical protein GGR58DRAFT_485534 [Xylaria digitata]|nr:hypothetical protein GGR58DRAFT_485534 [Xylaria digitata]
MPGVGTPFSCSSRSVVYGESRLEIQVTSPLLSSIVLHSSYFPHPTTMFASLLLLLSVIRWSKAACYDTSGIERDGFFPCNTSAEVSICCGGTDYCLDNGLCLDAFGDNIFTVQACTSATWDAPCKQHCPGLPPTDNYYQDLTLCKSTDKVSGSYCCGQNASCCSDSSALITLPIFNRVFKAPGVAGDTSAPESTPSQPNESRNQALKIGLGVGLGIGLSLLAFALAFNAWELRKKNKYLKLPKGATPATWPPHHKICHGLKTTGAHRGSFTTQRRTKFVRNSTISR